MEALTQFFAIRALPMHFTREVLTSENLTVYQAECSNTGDWAAVSFYPGLEAEKWGRMNGAVTCQRELIGIPGVMQIWDCDSYQTSESKSTIFTVEEWVEKDLAKDIEDRRQNGFVWTEDLLVNLANKCISTLAEMQRMGITHRNISLHSLRYDSITQTIKLGGFTQACKVENYPISVVWTPLMSPELMDLIRGQVGVANYDPFKADVYSLGVCLLSCCCWDLRGPAEVEENLVSRLRTVQSISMRSLLYCMLQRNPENRPDFLYLQQYIHSPGAFPSLSCPHPLPEYYYFPCHGKFCQSCVYFDQDYSTYCAICDTHYPNAQRQIIAPALIADPNEVVDMHFYLEEPRLPAKDPIHVDDSAGPLVSSNPSRPNSPRPNPPRPNPSRPRPKSWLERLCCCFASNP